ncbi:MAG: hypothetical protein KDK23_02525 [Leptospiraceae bacterium]|nr:hypothetical protein [Leptospiraceae bacterium]
MEPWVVYPATNWSALFALVFVLCLAGLAGAGWFAFRQGNRCVFFAALLALAPLTLLGMLDWHEANNYENTFEDSLLQKTGESIVFRTRGLDITWKAHPAYYSVRREQSSDQRTGKVTILLQDLYGPTFEIQSLAVGEEIFPQVLQKALLRLPGVEAKRIRAEDLSSSGPQSGEKEKNDAPLPLQGQEKMRKAEANTETSPSLPVIDEAGLVLDAKKRTMMRTVDNAFTVSRQKASARERSLAGARSLHGIVRLVTQFSRQGYADPFPSAETFRMDDQMLLEYSSESPSFSRYGFSWLLFCLLGLFFYILLLDAKAGLLGAVNSAGLWLCIGTLALLVYTLPDPGSKSFQLVADQKEISLQTSEENKRWSFEDVAYVRCESPGSGIILYRENPEEILWEETSRHLVAGDKPMARGQDYLQLMESAFNSSAAALRMMQNSFTIPGGRLSPVEQVQLCSILGRLAARAKPQW